MMVRVYVRLCVFECVYICKSGGGVIFRFYGLAGFKVFEICFGVDGFFRVWFAFLGVFVEWSFGVGWRDYFGFFFRVNFFWR